MGLLYVDENGAVIGVEANRCTVTYTEMLRSIQHLQVI